MSQQNATQQSNTEAREGTLLPAGAIIVDAPPAGQENVLQIQPGKLYVLSFPATEIEDISLIKGDMRLTLEDGGILVLQNYEAATDAANPASFAFEGGAFTGDLADFILGVQEGDVLVDITAITGQDAAEAANVEPAAGQDGQSAQQAAQIQPQAGDGASAGAAGGYGYGFNSNFSPTAVPPTPQPVGAIGATALSFPSGPQTLLFEPLQLQTQAQQTAQTAPFNPTPIITSNPGADAAESLLFMHQPGAIGQITVNYNGDTPGRVTFDGTFTIEGFEEQGLELTSGGQPVTVNFDATNNAFRGFDADGNLLFTLVLDRETGTYVFSLLGPLDHPDSANPGDVININFAFTATDSNGDQARETMRVTITDTGPQIACPTELHVSENLEIGQTITDQINVEFNADGRGDVNGNGMFSVDNLEEYGLELTSGGQPVTVALDGNGNYIGTLPDGSVIFTLTFDANGLYSFTLSGPLDHLPGSAIDQNITLHFGFTATDGDGDGVSDFVHITINDDMPQLALATEFNVDEAVQIGIAVSEQINVEFGRDGHGDINGNGVFSVDNLEEHGLELTSGGQPVAVTLDASGNYIGTLPDGSIVFTLAFDANGSCMFTLVQGLDHIQGTPINDVITLHFGFTATDGDGDSITDSITINIFGDPAHADGLVAIDTSPGGLHGTALYGAEDALINLVHLAAPGTSDGPQDALGALHAQSPASLFTHDADPLQGAIDHFISHGVDKTPIIAVSKSEAVVAKDAPLYSPADHVLGSADYIVAEIKNHTEALAA